MDRQTRHSMLGNKPLPRCSLIVPPDRKKAALEALFLACAKKDLSEESGQANTRDLKRTKGMLSLR